MYIKHPTTDDPWTLAFHITFRDKTANFKERAVVVVNASPDGGMDIDTRVLNDKGEKMMTLLPESAQEKVMEVALTLIQAYESAL